MIEFRSIACATSPRLAYSKAFMPSFLKDEYTFGSTLLVYFLSFSGSLMTTNSPRDVGTRACLSNLNLELLASAMPPKRQAAASSYAPVIEAPESFEARQEILRIEFESSFLESNFDTALTEAIEIALELFNPAAGGISDSTLIETASSSCTVDLRNFSVYLLQVAMRSW